MILSRSLIECERDSRPLQVIHKRPAEDVNHVRECEPQGWIMNWMMDRLTVYQYRELESTEQFGERIFWMNHFNEWILEIQYSKKNCHSHH